TCEGEVSVGPEGKGSPGPAALARRRLAGAQKLSQSPAATGAAGAFGALKAGFAARTEGAGDRRTAGTTAGVAAVRALWITCCTATAGRSPSPVLNAATSVRRWTASLLSDDAAAAVSSTSAA